MDLLKTVQLLVLFLAGGMAKASRRRPIVTHGGPDNE
jgi:hypothetical protein